MDDKLPPSSFQTTRQPKSRSGPKKFDPTVVATALARTVAEVQADVKLLERDDPAMAFAKLVLAGKEMTAADLFAEMQTGLKVRSKLRVSSQDFFVHGEETLAIRKTAKDLTGEVRLGSLHDAIDGTDLRELGIGNDCSAAIALDPTEVPGQRILAAVIGLPSEAVYLAFRGSNGVCRWKIKGRRLASDGPQPVSLRTTCPTRLADAIISSYSQKITSIQALIRTGFFERWEEQDEPRGRFQGLSGMPMVPRLLAPVAGRTPFDVILETGGQAPHDMAPGAYIGYKAGVAFHQLDGSPFSLEQIEDAALHPASDQYKMRYVMAITQTLAEEAISWLGPRLRRAS
jgi:hypothetical protein